MHNRQLLPGKLSIVAHACATIRKCVFGTMRYSNRPSSCQWKKKFGQNGHAVVAQPPFRSTTPLLHLGHLRTFRTARRAAWPPLRASHARHCDHAGRNTAPMLRTRHARPARSWCSGARTASVREHVPRNRKHTHAASRVTSIPEAMISFTHSASIGRLREVSIS